MNGVETYVGVIRGQIYSGIENGLQRVNRKIKSPYVGLG